MIAMKIGTCNQWIDAFMTQVWVYFRTFSKYSSPDNICFNLIYKADVFWQNTAVSQIQIIWSNINVTRCCWRSDKRLSFYWRMTALSALAFTHIDAWGVIISPPVLNFPINLHISFTFTSWASKELPGHKSSWASISLVAHTPSIRLGIKRAVIVPASMSRHQSVQHQSKPYPSNKLSSATYLFT